MIDEFIKALKSSVADNSFAKLSMTGYEGGEQDLKKTTVRPIIVKREEKLSFTYTYKTKDIVKNHTPDEAFHLIKNSLKDFRSATLFTTEYDLSYPSLKKSGPTVTEAPTKEHDRAKVRSVDAAKPYLNALGVTDSSGKVIPGAQDKYRQIDKYVEILGGLLKDIPKDKIKNIVDMGAGKGYLTFALYDHLRDRGIGVNVTGVEYRQDLVSLCNKIAHDCGYDRLSFQQGTIEDYDDSKTDILIALHACDTATDDAIAKGIAGQAELIVVAPCCHKQVRREMEKMDVPDLDFMLRHGIFMERQAEMVTDAVRALILEYFGYSVKVFEFISDAHTAKNVMITARRNPKAQPSSKILEKISAAKKRFGVSRHALEEKTGL